MTTHQLDRIEQMLQALTSAHSPEYMHKGEVSRLVVGLVASLSEKGRRIDTIKLYRALTGFGLKESKDAVEKFWSREA